MLGPALIARLEGDAAVTGLVGQRIYWLVKPQGRTGDLPAIVLQRISEERLQHLKGFEDMFSAHLQVACLALELSTSHKLAEVAIAALIPFADAIDPSGPDVLFWRGSVDNIQDLGNQEDTRFVHRAVVDLTIRYGTAA